MLKNSKKDKSRYLNIPRIFRDHAACLARRLLCPVFILAIILQPFAIQAEQLTIERITSLPSLTGYKMNRTFEFCSIGPALTF